MSAFLAQMEELTSRRRYVPSEIWGDELDLDKFEEYECDERWVIAPNEETGRCSCCDQHYFGKTVIIAIDGACSGNGGANATAACGTFGNIGSELNNAFILHEPRPTSQRAELHAAISALESLQTVYDTLDRATLLDEVIIKTDSAYLINSAIGEVTVLGGTSYPLRPLDLLLYLHMIRYSGRAHCIHCMPSSILPLILPSRMTCLGDPLCIEPCQGPPHDSVRRPSNR